MERTTNAALTGVKKLLIAAIVGAVPMGAYGQGQELTAPVTMANSIDATAEDGVPFNEDLLSLPAETDLGEVESALADVEGEDGSGGDARPASPISLFGEALVVEEFRHRSAMAKKLRELERERVQAQISEQITAQARLKRQIAEAEEALRPPPPIQAIPTGFAAQQIQNVPPPPPPAPIVEDPPRVTGVIGSTGVFLVDGRSIRAGVGETVSGFRVQEVSGRRIQMQQISNPSNVVMQTVR